MAKRNTPSSIDKLPPEIRELIGRLRLEQGISIDSIHAKLLELDVEVSRSALGRHVRSLAEVSEKIRRSREITESLSRQGNRGDNKMLRGTIELLNSILLDVSLAQVEVEGQEGTFEPVQFNPLQVKALAQTAESLARAEKIDADREAKIRAMATEDAAKRVSTAAKAKGLSPETVDWIYKEALGVAG
ncbi:MAG: phage protein Gp27 family protein [Sphingomonas sp.]